MQAGTGILSHCIASVPGLTPAQKSIKSQQNVSKGNSANHLLECLAPRGTQARHHMSTEPVQAGSTRRTEGV